MMKSRKKVSPFTVILLTILAAYGISLIVLILWGFMTSLKDQSQFRTNVLWLPSGMPWRWKWSNYVYVFQHFEIFRFSQSGKISIGMGTMLRNTLLYAVGTSFFGVFARCVTAYMCAKFDYKYSRVIYSTVLIMMMVTIIGSMPAQINLLRFLRLYDKIWSSWIMSAGFLGTNFLIFYANFSSIPKDFSEAAYVDGASEFTVLFKIMLPMAKNVFLTLFLLGFIGAWNDYSAPLIYLPSYPTIGYGVYYLSLTNTLKEMSTVPMRLTTAFIMLIPIMIIFLLLQKKILNSVSFGGIKE